MCNFRRVNQPPKNTKIRERGTTIIQNDGTSQQKHALYKVPHHPTRCAEPEIAFRLSIDIHEPLTANEVINHVDGVAAAIEIIDSRYENFKFSLEDVVADNCSSCAFIVGKWCDVPLGLNGLDMKMSFDGQNEAEGSSDAILDNPFEALAAATRLAQRYNIKLKKGMIVLAGASTAASFIKETSSVKLKVDGLGETSFTIV